MNRGNAIVIGTMLYARDTSLPLEEIADGLYDVIDQLDFGSDERKADLYATLAESLTSDTPFEVATQIIERALDRVQARYPQ